VPDTPLDYQAMVQRALRGVLREALAEVAEEGLPEDHHFYVGFRTSDPGVMVPRFLRERYPEEMTVVLQNQFWGLEVDDEGFSVTLAFGGSRHPVFVPWEAVTNFVDPPAEFALRFDLAEEGGEAEEGEGVSEKEAEAPGSPEASAPVVNLRDFRKKDE
jgi:hypothetical protein